MPKLGGRAKKFFGANAPIDFIPPKPDLMATPLPSPLPPILPFLLLPFPPISSPSPPLLMQLGNLGDCCKLPLWGLEQSNGRKRILQLF